MSCRLFAEQYMCCVVCNFLKKKQGKRKQPPDPELVLWDDCLDHIRKRMFKEKTKGIKSEMFKRERSTTELGFASAV